MEKALPAVGLPMTISYLYLRSYCPMEYVFHFNEASSSLREALAQQAGVSEEEYAAVALPAACRSILTYHNSGQTADEAEVAELVQVAKDAGNSSADAIRFNQRMWWITSSLPKANSSQKPNLYNKSGFKICPEAAKYVHFSLVSKPNYKLMNTMLAEEAQKNNGNRNPIEAMWTFTLGHLWRTLGIKQAFIEPYHLGHLAFCLLTLGIHKSRLSFPETEMEAFHKVNEAHIQNFGN